MEVKRRGNAVVVEDGLTQLEHGVAELFAEPHGRHARNREFKLALLHAILRGVSPLHIRPGGSGSPPELVAADLALRQVAGERPALNRETRSSRWQ